MNKQELAGIIAISSALTACGGGGSDNGGNTDNSGGTGSVGGNNNDYSKPSSKEEAARFLLQSQLNTSVSEINSLFSSNYKDYLTNQFNLPVSQSAVDWLNSKGYNAVDNYAYFDNTYPGDCVIWQQLFKSNDNLRKRISLALSEFFVVSLSGLNMAWRSHAIASWWDMINNHCFSTYRELLYFVSTHPAMGNYLNIAGSKKENAAGRQPDENYAREVMQLFSIGLYQLNSDGTEKTENGKYIDTYNQSDITNLAKIFTGWNYDNSQNVPTTIVISGNTRNVPNTLYTILPMTFNSADHSSGAATFLGSTVAAGTDGYVRLNSALDIIANHSNVAPFFCKQMIKKLVTSNPSNAYVSRVVSVFNNNGNGVRGDLKSVFSAILLDPEARNLSNINNPSFGKVREPMLRFIQWGRTFSLNSKFGYWKIGDRSSNFGQSPLRSPSVFNFFRPNYVPPNTQLALSQMTAPEFQIVNESTVSSYINYMQNVLKTGIYVNAPDVPNATSNSNNGYEVLPDYTEALNYVNVSTDLVNYLDLILNAGQTSTNNKNLIVSAIDSFGVTTTSNSSNTLKINKISAAILLIISSADYIIQR